MKWFRVRYRLHSAHFLDCPVMAVGCLGVLDPTRTYLANESVWQKLIIFLTISSVCTSALQSNLTNGLMVSSMGLA